LPAIKYQINALQEYGFMIFWKGN